MRVSSFRVDGRASYGIASVGTIREASTSFRDRFPDVRSVLAAGALPDLEADEGGARFESQDVTFLPPVPTPDKIICVGVNYRPHAEEMGRELPEHPMLFVRFPGSIVGHGSPIIRPGASAHYDFEGEFAVVIGKTCRHVSRDQAAGVIAGYSCFMDGSVRDWQRHTSQFIPGKNFNQSGAMGPELVTCDEVANPAALRLETRVNGVVMQNGCLDELIFDVPALIEYCSTFAELLPGDVIATGTPGGVGAARTPPQWLHPGDRVAVAIDGIGQLENVVSAEQVAGPGA